MPTEIGGIPLHPLVVHAVVVLVPLVALGSIGVAVVGRWRVRYGVPLLGLGVVALGASLVARQTGEELEDAVNRSASLDRHTDLGDVAWLFVAAMVALLAALVAVAWSRSRRAARPGGAAARARAPETVLAVLLVLASLAAAGQVTLTGHSGAESVWNPQDPEPRD